MFVLASGLLLGISSSIWQGVNSFVCSLVFVEHTLSQGPCRRIRFLFGVGVKRFGFVRCVKADLARLLSVVAGACCESSQGFRLLCHEHVLRIGVKQERLMSVPFAVPVAR